MVSAVIAHFQTILHGLRALQIEESAKEIRSRVEELGRHIGSYDEYMQKLDRNALQRSRSSTRL